MLPETYAVLESLAKMEWFTKVGTPDDDGDVMVVNSWEEAVQHCSSVAWGNLCLEAANQLRARIHEKSPERFGNWNRLAGNIRVEVNALVERETLPFVEKYNLPSAFVSAVKWDILHLCMETEYADIVKPAFYASQAYWYVNGRFPCGWIDGTFPKGRLVIY